jgi:hypothetical protein
MHHLVVTRPFLEYVCVDIITDTNKVTKILATEYKKFVTKITPPNEPKG